MDHDHQDDADEDDQTADHGMSLRWEGCITLTPGRINTKPPGPSPASRLSSGKNRDRRT
jgi:hypothetical protein